MIEQDPTKQSVDERLKEVLCKWLNGQEESTWNQLVAALEPIDRALAIIIKKKYLD